MAICALHAEVLGGMQLRWQALVIQAGLQRTRSSTALELALAGTLTANRVDTDPASIGPAAAVQSRATAAPRVLDRPQAVVKL